MSARWRRPTWFVPQEPGRCLSLADEMYECWCEPGRREWLLRAFALYLESYQQQSSDIALMIAQVILELLCNVILFDENKLISADGLKSLPTADRIRALLLWAGIPPTIPKGMSSLRQAFEKTTGTGTSMMDGPKAITEIRNSTVHAKASIQRSHISDWGAILIEAWDLCFWYAELVLLKYFGYNGPYVSRVAYTIDPPNLNRGFILVPWAAPDVRYF